jgi:hypothetical protein
MAKSPQLISHRILLPWTPTLGGPFLQSLGPGSMEALTPTPLPDAFDPLDKQELK